MPYNQKQLDEIEAQGGFDEDEDTIPVVDFKLSNYDLNDYISSVTFSGDE